MNIEKLLINEENIKYMTLKENKDFNVKKLLNNNLLTQSFSIKFGILFERFIKSIIRTKGYKLINEELQDVFETGTKTNKGKKDIDICFIKGDTIFYFESKLNLNLDSEKSKATDQKVNHITKFLTKVNDGYKIYSGLITCWWEREEGMSITTKTHLLFMKDLFNLLEIDYDKSRYYDMMSKFGNQNFDPNEQSDEMEELKIKIETLKKRLSKLESKE